MNDQSSEFFEQVNDDLKRKQLKEMWKENKYWIIGGIVGSIIATGAMAAWREWEFNRNVKATSELTELVRKSADVKAIEDFANNTNKNHSVIARLILASIYLEKGNNEEAVKVYNEISSTFGADKIYKNFAKLLSVKYRSQAISSDAILKELEPLTSKSSGWTFSARELKATILARQGKFDQAVEVLNTITSSPDAPERLRQRAIKLTELYEAENSIKK